MKQKAINIITYIVSAPIVLFEYFVLFWFWGGADAFNFILTPVVFGIYLIVILFLNKKNRVRSSLTLLVKLIYVLILPILTIVTVWLFAIIFGINIIIW